MRHAPLLEIKTDGEDDPADVVTKALDEFRGTVDERLKAVEAKADTTKLTGRLDKLEAKLNRPGAAAQTEDERATVEKKAFSAYLRHGAAAPADEVKALTVSSDPSGGYLAPAEFSTEILREITEISPIRSLASVRSTASPSVVYPKRIGRTNAAWRGETQATTGSEPSFGQLEIVVHELATHTDISNLLLADSAGAADSEVRMSLAEDFALKEGVAFLRGSGVGQPQGILAPAAGVPTIEIKLGDWNPVTGTVAQRLVDVFYALKSAHRGRASWLMNASTLAVVRKLEDGEKRSLWQPSLVAGRPETILGRPVVEVPDLDDSGTIGNLPIVFGDFEAGYRIVDRVAMSILVNPYLLATNGLTRIHATRRVGGAVIKADAMRIVKVIANA